MSHCIACGYDLVGRGRGARCPECGATSTNIELKGGLAGVGVMSARPAARWSVAVAVLMAVPLAFAILARLVDARFAVHAVIRDICAFAWALALFGGVYLSVLVGRMLPQESAWRRVLWVVMAGRIVAACALLAFEFATSVPYELVTQLNLLLAADLLQAVAVARIAPTGGLSRASAVPAYTAVAASAYGMVISSLPLDFDSTGVLSGIMRSGAVGAVACAVALWRIDRELRGPDGCQARAVH